MSKYELTNDIDSLHSYIMNKLSEINNIGHSEVICIYSHAFCNMTEIHVTLITKTENNFFRIKRKWYATEGKNRRIIGLYHLDELKYLESIKDIEVQEIQDLLKVNHEKLLVNKELIIGGAFNSLCFPGSDCRYTWFDNCQISNQLHSLIGVIEGIN